MKHHLVPHNTVCIAGLRGIPGVMGGVEAHCEALYPRLADRMGERYNFVLLARAPYVADVMASYGPVTVVPLWSARSQYLETISHTALAVIYSRFAFKAKLIHIHAIGSGLLAPLAKALGMRVILTYHGEDYLRRHKWNGIARTVLRLGEYFGVRSADKIIVVSPSVAERLKRRFPDQADSILFIPNGAQAEAPAEIEPKTSAMGRWNLTPGGFVLSVGRLDPGKGFHDLIAAFRQSGIPGQLVIAGDVEYANAYTNELRGSADDRVIFTGRLDRDALNELYANASLFVLPSYHEGLPIVALEALAQGAPVLLSDIQANRDIALPNANYFRTGDVDDLADAMRRPHESLRVDGATLLRTYNWDRIAKNTGEVIASLEEDSMTGKPRLLFVINSLEGGGAERVIVNVVAGIRREMPTAKITLALLDKRPEMHAAPDSIDVVRLDCNGSTTASIRRLARFARAYRPEVIVSFLTRANIASVVAARAAGAHCIISERVHTSSHFGTGLSADVSKAVVRRIYRRADTIVSVSEGVARDLALSFGIPEDRLVTINNPVDRPAIEAAAEDAPTIDLPDDFVLAVGRLVPNKNFAMLIEAYARAGVSPHLVILGEGPLRSTLVDIARTLGVADRVHLPGYVENPHSVMRRASLYVSASNAEGFPNAMVEAMVLGCPVVATDCHSGPSEILAMQPEGHIVEMTRAKYGILVPPEAREAMALGLREMMQKETRDHYSVRARERAATFDAQRVIKRYAELVAPAQASSSP